MVQLHRQQSGGHRRRRGLHGGYGHLPTCMEAPARLAGRRRGGGGPGGGRGKREEGRGKGEGRGERGEGRRERGEGGREKGEGTRRRGPRAGVYGAPDRAGLDAVSDP